MKDIRTLFSALFLAPLACAPSGLELDCDDGKPNVTINITSPSPDTVVDASIVVRGTVTVTKQEDEDGQAALAVQQVIVAGKSAELDAFNFREWSVAFTPEELEALAASQSSNGEDASGAVKVQATAWDACGIGTEPVDLELKVQATQLRALVGKDLEVAPRYPARLNGQAYKAFPVTYLADQNQLLVDILAPAPAAAGARVSVRVNNTDAGDWLLEEVGLQQAKATAEIRGDYDGSAWLVTASAGPAYGSAVVRFGDAPKVFPQALTVAAGVASLRTATLLTTQFAGECRWDGSASPDAVTVKIGESTLTRGEAMAYPVGSDTIIEISVGPSAPPAEFTLECRDDFGQVGELIFQIES